MRKCLRCQTQMMENATLHDRGCVTLKGGAGTFGIFEEFTLNAAVCPNCGEVSLYLEDFEKFAEKANQKEEYYF